MTAIDLRMVASLATAAYTHGDRMCGAIADHYNITRRDAKTLLTRARRAGHDIPMDRRGPQGTLRHGTRYHYRKGCHCDACVAANRAHQLEQQARRSAGRANPGRPPVERGAVRCSCGQQCKDRTALGAHCWSQHDRPPTDAERVIIAEQVGSVNPYAELLDRADRDLPECGTIAAYTAHRRRGEQPCGPCRTAANTYNREHTAAEPTRGRSADAARRIALDDHRRLRAELQAAIAAEQGQP